MATITPTEEQHRAITAGEGLVRTQSGAGTGKTFMLTHRLKWLSDQGIDPQNILAFSFTRASARELGERAASMSSKGQFTTSTIHSMAVRILRAFGPVSVTADQRWAIMDSTSTESLFKTAVSRWVETHANQGFNIDDWDDLTTSQKVKRVMKESRSVIDSWKERMFSPNEVLDRYSGPDYEFSDMLMYGMIYDDFQQSLHDSSVFEISDLIPEAIRIMESSRDIYESVSSTFNHVLVDEFQDVNLAQVRFIEMLSAGHKNLTIVGDSDQSIYLFRHAIPNAMERACDFFPKVSAVGVSDHVLSINRRNPEAVLKCANNLVDYNPRPEPKKLTSGKPGSAPAILKYGNDNQEAASVISKIRKLIEAGTRPDEIAILARTNSILNKIIARAAAMGVPHEVASGMRFVDRRQVRDMMAWLRLALNPACTVSFERAVGAPSRKIGVAALKTIKNYAAKNGVNYIDALRGCIADNLIKPKQEAGEMADIMEDLVAMSEEPETPPDMFIREVLNRTDYLSWASGQGTKPETARETVMILSNLAAEMKRSGAGSRLEKFIDDIMLSEDVTGSGGAVRIGSIHSSKGLEWDHVFIIGMEEGTTPSAMSLHSMGDIDEDYDPWATLSGCLEEERRLIYVAATRGRSKVYMTVTRQRNGKPFASRPSRFLEEMGIPVYTPRSHQEADFDVNQDFQQARIAPRKIRKLRHVSGYAQDGFDPSP